LDSSSFPTRRSSDLQFVEVNIWRRQRLRLLNLFSFSCHFSFSLSLVGGLRTGVSVIFFLASTHRLRLRKINVGDAGQVSLGCDRSEEHTSELQSRGH